MKSTAQPASDIIYDWNTRDAAVPLVPPGFSLFDETLRDGIQSPSVHDPSIEDKLQIVHLLDQLGIEYLDLSLPGAGPRALEDGVRLVKEIADCKLRIRPACAARTHLNDIRPIAEIAQRTGVAVEVMTFIGSSPIRLYAEDWDEARMLKLSAEAIDFSVQNGLPCTYVTEDTTRARPEMLASLFKNALDHGSQRLCICDTVGHATPAGVSSLLGFTRSVIDGMGLSGKIGIDWHGHNDRGLGVINALWALRCGADRVHGTVLGIGERVGNAAIDQILVNLYLMGALPEGRDLSQAGGASAAGLTRVQRADSLQLPGAGRRCVSHCDGRACGCHHQGRAQRRCLFGGSHLLKRAGSAVWSSAGDRDRSHVRRVQRDVLAGAARRIGLDRGCEAGVCGRQSRQSAAVHRGNPRGGPRQ
jgi:hypothetical protein